MQLSFTTETSADGVVERSFTLGEVPGVLWSPVSPRPHAPLLLMGHGGGLHKRAPGLVARARRAVLDDGFHVASIDAPGHGDRPRSLRDQRSVEAILRARRAGEPLTPVVNPFNRSLAERAVPEWRATLDALLTQTEIGPAAPVGYTGMTLATMIGIPLVVADDRVRAATFGGVLVDDPLLEVARQVTVPVLHLLPWDDPELDRGSALAVLDAYASQDKTLIAFPGSHSRVPADRIDARFFPRLLAPDTP